MARVDLLNALNDDQFALSLRNFMGYESAFSRCWGIRDKRYVCGRKESANDLGPT